MARIGAAKLTKQLVLRRGRKLGMYLGCSYPKSGTTWLCQMLGTALGIPYPRDYRSPIAMSSVVHAHWRYDPRLPPTAYIRRDGRDVMVSLYHHYTLLLQDPYRPRSGRISREHLMRLYGKGFDPRAVRENLPRFIEYVTTARPSSDGLSWQQHIQDWSDRRHVALLTYEELQQTPVRTLTRVMQDLGVEPDEDIVSLAVDRWSFVNTSGRKRGEEDRTSYQRKGVSGDWVNHFSREAGQVFDAVAGDTLVELGYAKDRDWYRHL